MEKTYSQRLSRFLADISYDSIPKEAIDQAKRLTLHVLGASIGARPIEQTGKTIAMTLRKGGAVEATVWGSGGGKVPAREAAFANGTIADIMDWEDCAWTGHPSAGAVPAAMAMGEKLHLSGRGYLTSLVTAFEGYHRIAMAVQPSREYILTGQGWGLVSWQVFAAAIAAAKARGMDADQMEQVFGAAFYNAIVSCNKHSEGSAKSDIYHYAHGWCARNGVISADVTELGFSNCYGAFDGANGFWHKVSDRCDWDWFVKDYGTKWYICETYLKHWPANMWVQTPLEALDRLMKARPFTTGEVEKIHVTPLVPFICGDYAKTTRSTLDAQFSIPYCLSAYIMDPHMGAQWFSEERRHDPELIAFAERFTYSGGPRTPNDNFDEFKTGSFPEISVTVTLKDGTVLTETMRYPKGHPRNNFTMEEEYDHFRLCCGPYMPAGQIEQIIALVADLEELDDIGRLAELSVLDPPPSEKGV